MKNTLFLILLTMGLFYSCKSTKYTPADYPEAQLIFGSGGGFTGMYTDFILFENGQLFKKKSNEESFTALDRVKANKAKQLFNNYQTLKLGSYEYDQPGNMNYYFRLKDKNGEHKISWGDMGPGLKEEVKLYYQLLNDLVKDNK